MIGSNNKKNRNRSQNNNNNSIRNFKNILSLNQNHLLNYNSCKNNLQKNKLNLSNHL
jgi:hypothetical protein